MRATATGSTQTGIIKLVWESGVQQQRKSIRKHKQEHSFSWASADNSLSGESSYSMSQGKLLNGSLNSR